MLDKMTWRRIRGINRKRDTTPMFIKPQHPGAGTGSIAPTDERIRKVISYGWWGQTKINGYSWQGHIAPDAKMTCYTRQGRTHNRKLHTEISEQILDHILPKTKNGYTVLAAEWQHELKILYIFDVYKLDGESFQRKTYTERYKILRDELFIIAPNVKILPVYRTVKQCMDVLEKARGDKFVDGLVFKNPKTPGWQNSSIVRCLKGKR